MFSALLRYHGSYCHDRSETRHIHHIDSVERELRYPPISRVALLTLRGRNEDKVKFAADHLKGELERELSGFPDLILAGPAPAPLARAESHYRHQILLRSPQMTRLSKSLAKVMERPKLPDDLTLTVDIDPVNLA